MLELPLEITIYDCWNDKLMPASIVNLTVNMAHDLIDGSWWKHIPTERRHKEVDGRWSWSELTARARYKDFRGAFAVKLSDGFIGAAAIVEFAVSSALDPSAKAVLLDRLATAPANRPGLALEPRFRGCGEGLLRFVVAKSYDLGLGGRVILYCAGNSEFYESFGFAATDEQSDGNILYELCPDRARRLLL